MDLSSITSKVLVSDVLTETNMKPWWEVLRGIYVAFMFLSALAMLPLSWTATIHCLPTFSNTTLTDPEFLYINRVCNENLPWNNIKNMGLFVIAIAFIIHNWYSWWLMTPAARKKFQTVRKFDDEYLDKVVLESTSGGSVEENLVEIINLAKSLWSREQKRVVILYTVRNVVGIFLLLGAVSFSVWLMCVSIAQGPEYKCKIDMGVKKIDFKDFTCSIYTLTGSFLGMMIVYVTSLSLQCVITICVVFYFNTTMQCPVPLKCCIVKHRFNDWEFIWHFSTKADDDLSEKTKKLLLDKDEIKYFTKSYIPRAVEGRDFDFLNLYRDQEDEIKDITYAVKSRILEKKVTDEDLKQFSKYCKEVRMYESFVLAHYKNFGQNSEKNYDYKDCGCCKLKIDLSDKDTYTKNSLLHYVLTSRTKTENGEVIFNRLAIKHLLRWVKIRRPRLREILLQPAQPEEGRREVEQNIEQLIRYCGEETELFELSLILQECEYRNEIGITEGNQKRYNVYRAIRNEEEVTAEMKNFVFGDDKSFYKELSKFWLRNKFYREYVELHKLFYSSRDDLKHGNNDCGCNEMTFHLTDTEPGSKGRSLIYYVLVNLDPGSEAMEHVLKRGKHDLENMKVVIRGENYVGTVMDYVNQQQNNATLIQTLKECGYQVEPARDGDGNDNIA